MGYGLLKRINNEFHEFDENHVYCLVTINGYGLLVIKTDKQRISRI